MDFLLRIVAISAFMVGEIAARRLYPGRATPCYLIGFGVSLTMWPVLMYLARDTGAPAKYISYRAAREREARTEFLMLSALLGIGGVGLSLYAAHDLGADQPLLLSRMTYIGGGMTAIAALLSYVMRKGRKTGASAR